MGRPVNIEPTVIDVLMATKSLQYIQSEHCYEKVNLQLTPLIRTEEWHINFNYVLEGNITFKFLVNEINGFCFNLEAFTAKFLKRNSGRQAQKQASCTCGNSANTP